MKPKTWINLIVVSGLLVASFGVMPATQPAAQAATIIRVKPGGSTSFPCGDNWANACALQTALINASAGDEIWVQGGTGIAYKPTSGTERFVTFWPKNGVALYGGFVGNETSREERNWESNITVLSGDIDNNDITDADGVVTDTGNINGNNSYHVVTGSYTDSSTILDGFTITGGKANGGDPHDVGGGMQNVDGSPTLRNITFSGNSAATGGGMGNSSSSPSLTNVTFSGNSAITGGGMGNSSSSPSLTNVTFSGNSATGDGGGMGNSSSSPSLTSVTFSGNSATGDGGGMYNTNSSSPTLTDVTFSDNSAGSYGGGMYNLDSSSPTLTNVIFSGNSATHGGGGMFNSSSSPSLTDVTFTGNSATGDGGGMYNTNSSSPTLSNVTFSGNSADYGGGMYNLDSSSPTLVNVTFSNNSATYSGGGMYNYSSSPTLTDVTFSDNSATHGGGMVNFYSSPDMTDVTFNGNSADSFGGGMYNHSSSPTLTDVTFSGNSADAGGGMYNWESSPTLTNVTFNGNSADSFGGGMYNWESSPTLTNATFSGNSADQGGGMYNDGSIPTLTNVTFSGNSADWGGGMYNYDFSSPTLTNSILWGNTASSWGHQIYNDAYNSATVNYSDIQGGWSGDGNINQEPQFVDADGPDDIPGTLDDNLRLQLTSPAIDAGNDTAPGLAGITTDLDGNPRFYDVPDTGVGPWLVDMGAYERQANKVPAAEDDSYSTNEDVPLLIGTPGILANDSDPDDDLLTAVLESGPSSGSLDLNSDGSFEYLPETDYSGVVTFTYYATDSLLDSNTATVTISIIEVEEVYLPIITR